MGLIKRVVRDVIPVSEVGVALWAWRHRTEIGNWIGYGARSVPRLQSSRDDVLVEGKVLARFTVDRRTRGVDGLRVQVEHGVARLSGTVSDDVRDAAVAIASNTGGVVRVRDETRSGTRL